MHFSFLGLAALLLPLVSADQVCTFVDAQPPPAGYICGGRGSIATPKLLGSTVVNNRTDCALSCSYQPGCVSFGMQGTGCYLYGKPLKQMGYKAAPKSATRFWAAACFKKQCQDVSGPCPGPTKDTIQWPLSNADKSQYITFGGSYNSQLTWTSESTNLPLFYIGKDSSLCSNKSIVYSTGPEDSLHDPPWTMDLWKGNPLYLNEGSRTPTCQQSAGRLQCNYNGTQDLFYYCPPNVRTVILGSHNPAQYCTPQEIATA